MRRADMLSRIRQALARPGLAPTPPPPTIDGALMAVALPYPEDLARSFEDRARAVGMEVRRATRATLSSAVDAVLRQSQATRVAVSADAGITGPLGAPPQPFELDAGVTGVAAAVAVTGTLVLEPGPAQAGGLSLIPPLHVAIVRASQIVGRLSDVLDDGATPQPVVRVLVTGPSKTADIEGVLITGMHGPKRVVILLVDDA